MPDIEVYFGSNRDVTETRGKPPKFGEGFNHKGPHYIRFGSVVVGTSGSRANRKYKIKKINLAEERIPTEQADESKRKLGSNEVFEKVRKRMASGKLDSLCLIHGYAADFETAMLRGAELADKWGQDRDLCVFVFSWPANDAVKPIIGYHDDRRDAQTSGVAIARTFLTLRRFLEEAGREQHCEQSIHLCAHSMGNWALRHAVQALREEESLAGRMPRLLDHVFLMAADEDNDAFEDDAKLGLLPDLAKAVHVYFSEDDKALVVSDTTKRNPDRLGATGPRVRSGLPRKIDLVDCHLVDVVKPAELSIDEISRYLSQHQYYRLRKEVIDDVRQVLAGVQPSEIKGRHYVPEDMSYLIQPKPKRRTRKKTTKKAGRNGR